MKILFKGFDLHTTLRPCPFCAGHILEECDDGQNHDSGYVDYYIYCCTCFATGPKSNLDRFNIFKGNFFARALWNNVGILANVKKL